MQVQKIVRKDLVLQPQNDSVVIHQANQIDDNMRRISLLAKIR